MASTPVTVDHDDPKNPLLPVIIDHPIQRPAESFQFSLQSILTPKNVFILLGPLLCAVICLCVKLDGPTSSRNMLAVLAWIFVWWMTEAVPMPITSMAPLFLFPLFGICSSDDVAHSYMDDVIALFHLALAVEHYKHSQKISTQPFVSMWMHNVAAALLMMPVATGILQRFPTGSAQSPLVNKFCRAVVLGVIYSAAIGGISTLTGTGVNLILVGMWRSYFPEQNPISFNTWSFFAFPLALVIFFALWVILCCLYIRRGSSQALSAYLDRDHLKRELQLLGPMSFAEKVVLAVFSMLVVLWMTRRLTDDIPGWGALFNGRAGDGTVSVMMATLLFIIPNKKKPGEKLMDWNKCKKLPWNIILLLGAGFAIADGVKTSGLAEILSKALDFLEKAPYWGIAPAVCLISSLITEFMSNNATTTLVIPILIQIAKSMHVHPLLFMIPGSIGAQFSYLLPTSTPSNIVGFSTGHIEMVDMIKTGLPLKIVGIAVMSILMPTLGAYVFGTDRAI
ncbi:hypothetical protein G4B88_022618 [Cannabis sativa]|uniref:Tonoplast dicarboxylate transporter n=1 Tax=Cannabis sativa TaxID=3483 RepID=A0A7J6HX02_CANSA|nr:hypothetical protein G4B88_022618 [Cannabis sativa]